MILPASCSSFNAPWYFQDTKQKLGVFRHLPVVVDLKFFHLNHNFLVKYVYLNLAQIAGDFCHVLSAWKVRNSAGARCFEAG